MPECLNDQMTAMDAGDSRTWQLAVSLAAAPNDHSVMLGIGHHAQDHAIKQRVQKQIQMSPLVSLNAMP